MVIIHAKLYPMCSEVIPDGYIAVQDGKIMQLGPMVKIPENLLKWDQVIDLQGQMLYPGFIDAHTHLGMLEDGVGEEGDDINEMSDPVTPHLRSFDAIDPFDPCLADAWNAGITTMVASPGSANPIAGQIVALKTCGRSVDQMVIREPLAMKFALGENPKHVYADQDQAPMSRMATAALIRENLTKAKRYLADQEHAIESDEDLPELDFKSEALLPLIKREQRAHFHAHRAYDIMTAIRIAKEFDLDYVLIHCTEGYMISDLLAEEKARIVVGPLFGTRTKPELSRLTIENAHILMQSGLEVAISSDHPEVQVELLPLSVGVARKHGLTEEQALLSITYWAAKAVGVEDRIGSLAPGLDADFVVFRESPFDVQSSPEMVFLEGCRIR